MAAAFPAAAIPAAFPELMAAVFRAAVFRELLFRSETLARRYLIWREWILTWFDVERS
jgi:hypothetical protein